MDMDLLICGRVLSDPEFLDDIGKREDIGGNGQLFVWWICPDVAITWKMSLSIRTGWTAKRPYGWCLTGDAHIGQEGFVADEIDGGCRVQNDLVGINEMALMQHEFVNAT